MSSPPGSCIWLVRRKHYSLRLLWDPERAAPIFKRAVPIVAQIVAGLFIYNSDVIFLRAMRSTETVGYYAAAYTLLSFIANICTLYGMTLIPTLARLGKHAPEERALYHTALAQVFAVALPVSVGGMFLAPEIIRLAFGKNYAASGAILQVLMWAVLPYALRVVPWSGLIAHGHQRLAWHATAYAVVANLALNLVLIRAYGATWRGRRNDRDGDSGRGVDVLLQQSRRPFGRAAAAFLAACSCRGDNVCGVMARS